MSFFSPKTWLNTKADRHLRLPQCGKCGLYKHCNSPKMLPSGLGERKILFVAEAPGPTEDSEGTHLVGEAGEKLREILEDLDLDIDDCMKTNAIICHPKSKVTDLHIECCRPNLMKTIRETKPRVIVLLGGAAVRSLIPTEKNGKAGSITKWVGWKIPSHDHNCWICPTYHPSYLLRQNDSVLELLFREHLKEAIALEHEPIVGAHSLAELKQKVDVVTSSRQARALLRDLKNKTEGYLIAFDYETTGLKPERKDHEIVSVSLSVEGASTYAFMMNDSVARLLSVVLTKENLFKIAHNIKFEERWTKRMLGHNVYPWHWDTQMAAHVLDNRKGVTGLKFQSYVNFGVGDYASSVAPYIKGDPDGLNRMKEAPVKDLLTYNALDSLLTYMLMEKQKEVLCV